MLLFLQLSGAEIEIRPLLINFFVFSSAKSPLPLFAKEGVVLCKTQRRTFYLYSN